MAKNSYTKKELGQEEEANVFACYLLMPDPMFTDELTQRMHIGEDEIVTNLASIFQVPQWAVVLRLQLHHQTLNGL